MSTPTSNPEISICNSQRSLQKPESKKSESSGEIASNSERKTILALPKEHADVELDPGSPIGRRPNFVDCRLYPKNTEHQTSDILSPEIPVRMYPFPKSLTHHKASKTTSGSGIGPKSKNPISSLDTANPIAPQELTPSPAYILPRPDNTGPPIGTTPKSKNQSICREPVDPKAQKNPHPEPPSTRRPTINMILVSTMVPSPFQPQSSQEQSSQNESFPQSPLELSSRGL
jgi:hypothetical protein